jgi:hypothetical protein
MKLFLIPTKNKSAFEKSYGQPPCGFRMKRLIRNNPGQFRRNKTTKVSENLLLTGWVQMDVATEEAGGDQHRSNRVEQPRDNRSRSLVPTTPRNHSHRIDWREGGVEAEYRKARVHDRFPCFANRLLSVRLPYKFKPSNHTKYDGKTEPKQWLRIYSQSIELAGRDDDIKALFFPMALEAMSLHGLTS